MSLCGYVCVCVRSGHLCGCEEWACVGVWSGHVCVLGMCVCEEWACVWVCEGWVCVWGGGLPVDTGDINHHINHITAQLIGLHVHW